MGNMNISDRVVSLFDTEARPITKGKLKAPTKFDYKLFLQETEERVITGYQLHRGNPSDENLLSGALERHEVIWQNTVGCSCRYGIWF